MGNINKVIMTEIRFVNFIWLISSVYADLQEFANSLKTTPKGL
jgi:hypothetical protein